MAVCDVYCFKEGQRTGYLAVLDTFSNGKRNAVKLFGDMFGFNYKQIKSDLIPTFNVKTLRSPAKFGKYIKSVYPSVMINPININGVVFDLPYIQSGNMCLARWEPVFEDDISEKSFNILSAGLIVEYNFQQPIFISVLDAKRHIPKVNEERLLINISTGVITRSIKRASISEYMEATYHIENGNWICDSFNKVPIAGYKMR